MRIGGFDFDVIRDDPSHLDGDKGLYEVNLNRIRIANDVSRDAQDSTLLHEVIESFNSIYCLNLEHNIIEILEGAFFQFLKDNPLWFKIRRGS